MDIFSALAEPTRRNIIEMLARKGQLSASDIYDKFNVTPPAISQHLKILREAKLVYVEKKAQQRLYQVNPDTILQVEKWVKKMTQRWNERFDVLDALLKIHKRKDRHYGKPRG